jgi:hypothetical protein
VEGMTTNMATREKVDVNRANDLVDFSKDT